MEKKLIDINSFAINFVEDHPGFKYVNEIVEKGIRGEFKLLIPEILPFRAYWILTSKWGINKKEVKEIIFDFVKQYSSPIYVGLKRESLIQAYLFSNTFNHDIYDCYYLSLAIQENANTILTTDTDFRNLCNKLNLNYENPIPNNILKEFSSYK